jgi:peptidoglycan/xylan/chitin deacetylase (PgdA/CDA1 family)
VAACHYDVDHADSAFYNGDDRHVHCAIDIDTSTRVDLPSIETGLDRARDRGEVLELYTHQPGASVPWDKIESVLAGAQSRGLAFVTYGDFVSGNVPGLGTTGGLALSFDDAFVADWYKGRDLFQQYGARITFFIAFYESFSATYKSELRQLADDGHDIEAHSVTHQRGPSSVEARGLGAYMSEEIVPSIDLLRADGYDVTTFAYPYGARTGETDRAILGHVSLLRSVTYTWDSPATDPCPL